MDILLQIYGSSASTQVTHEDGLLVHFHTTPKTNSSSLLLMANVLPDTLCTTWTGFQGFVSGSIVAKTRNKLQHVHKCNKSYEWNYYIQSCRSMTLAITSLGGLLGHRKARILTPTIFGKVELLDLNFHCVFWSFWVAYWALVL